MSSEHRIDLATVRRRLDGQTGRRLWKSLEELIEAPGFLDFLHREFPEQASEWNDPAGRRGFLRLMGASMALAGLTACTRQPEEQIVPYVRQPEEVIPGRPLFFATAVTDRGYANGVLVESHMGRPTKVEGNPDHPGSLGATDIFGQAAILGLYDPDRSQTLTERGEIRSWGSFLAAMKTTLAAQAPLKGEGIRVLTGTVTSPTLEAQIQDLLQAFPAAKWHQFEAAGRENVFAGTELAFGEPLEPQYRLADADVILSLDSDFMVREPGSVRLIREFAARRRPPDPEASSGDGAQAKKKMNRLYAVETCPSVTGSNADHRLPLPPSEIEGFARGVAKGLGLGVEGETEHPWIPPISQDLRAHRGHSLVVAGESQPPAVHALAHAMNVELGNVGKTVVYTAPVAVRPADPWASLRELAADLDADKVDLLLILGGNPVYAAPGEIGFAQKITRARLRVHLGLYQDETAELSHWHVPEAHSLESWGDARAFDGTAGVLQPLIAPLYDGKTAHEVLAAFSGKPERSSHQIVQDHWKAAGGAADFERRWRRALNDGLWKDTAYPQKAVSLRSGDWMRGRAAAPATGFEIAFRPDPTVEDGRHANNGWLQELPKPLTKLTWDNAVLMSPRTAEALGIAPTTLTPEGNLTEIVELRYRGHSLEAPAWIVPGHADRAVTLHLGYGRRRAGRVGSGAGFDANRLRTLDAPWWGSGLDVRRTGKTMLLSCTQDHWSMEGRNLARSSPVAAYLQDPELFKAMGEDPDPSLTMLPPYKYDGHAWGMSIDLSACVGCNACMVACVSENNIAVVGKDQVGRGREMQWIRVDRYYEGDLDNPEVHHQPVPCQQCENAPCEQVCPVTATVHSDEGLNDMVYNRCVGTRYCSNNCPYKVRRFNFYLYQDWTTPTYKLMRNPDVTVRSRGVMEKCTYCVQRINEKRIDARNQGRPIRDGEIQTACQQACPAEAIVFGDINDAESRVTRLKAEPRNYGILTELNTRPRTSYLAELKNPNPEIHG